MPELKISEFPAKTSLGDTDLIPIVDGAVTPNVTKKITLANARAALQGPQGIQGIQGPEGETYNWKGQWLTLTAYVINDTIYQAGNGYVCLVNHTSGTFATDLASGYWSIFVSKGDQGEKGDTGDTGATGTNINLLYGTSETPPAADDGTLYVTYIP